jgi:hypothetical protein
MTIKSINETHKLGRPWKLSETHHLYIGFQVIKIKKLIENNFLLEKKTRTFQLS